MAQLTVDQHGVGTDVPTLSSSTAASAPAAESRAEDRGHPRLRSVLPAAVAVGLLLGVVVAGGVLLRDLLDFGLWFLGQG